MSKENVINETNYSFYMFKCNDPEIINTYVGSTKNFTVRKGLHKSDYNNENRNHYNLKVYNTIRENGGWDNWNMVQIHEQVCKSRTHSKQIEQELIEKHNADLNMIRAFISEEQIREYHQKYYKEHTNEIQEKQQKYYNENKDIFSINAKHYYIENKDAIKKTTCNYRINNRLTIRQKQQEKYNEKEDEIKQQQKEYYNKNKDKMKQQQKEYRLRKKLENINSQVNETI